MAELSNEDALQEKIKAYKASIKEKKPDLDVELLLRILDLLSATSEIHVAINPIDDEGWNADAPVFAVTHLKLDDERRFVLHVHEERHGITCEKLYGQVQAALKVNPNTKAPLYFLHAEKTIRLTEAYSHSLVKERWGGMPFDLVLAVKEQARAAQSQIDAAQR